MKSNISNQAPSHLSYAFYDILNLSYFSNFFFGMRFLRLTTSINLSMALCGVFKLLADLIIEVAVFFFLNFVTFSIPEPFAVAAHGN